MGIPEPAAQVVAMNHSSMDGIGFAKQFIGFLDIAQIQFFFHIGAADIPMVILGFHDHIQFVTINRLKFL